MYGYVVFGGIDAHTVAYMDRNGNEVGADGRHFFGSRQEAEAAAWHEWHNAEFSEHMRPPVTQ